MATCPKRLRVPMPFTDQLSFTDQPSTDARRRSRPRRPGLTVLSVALAAVLAVSACGSGADDEQAEAVASSDAAAGQQTTVDQESGDSATTNTTTAETATPETTTSDDTTSDSESEDPVEANFPMVEVLNVADGSTVQLADELAGGDKPILLWFWAPH